MKVDEQQYQSDDTAYYRIGNDSRNIEVEDRLRPGQALHHQGRGLQQDASPEVWRPEDEINLFEEDEELILTDLPFAFDNDFEEIRKENIRKVI